MFSENFHTLRKAKGYSQEELAIRLNVVRQTISKWEKGLSSPGADMLAKIAEIFEVSVSDLIGEKLEPAAESGEDGSAGAGGLAAGLAGVGAGGRAVVDQLSRINEQLIVANYRAMRRWRATAIAMIAFVLFSASGVVATNIFSRGSGSNADAYGISYTSDEFTTDDLALGDSTLGDPTLEELRGVIVIEADGVYSIFERELDDTVRGYTTTVLSDGESESVTRITHGIGWYYIS